MFAILEIKARIIAAAMIILRMQNISDQPKHLLSFNAVKSGTDQK